MARALAIVLLGCVAACGGDDAETADAAPCDLPAETIECTLGDNAPCLAVCGSSYCFAFGTGGGGGSGATICTKSCDTAADCPDGWSCNMMGRCKAP